jgi:hypothetical protein
MSYQITHYVLELEDLSPSEKAVAHSLAYHADKDGGNSYPSMERIAREAGLRHRQSAQRVVRRLERKGLIVAETQKTGGNSVTTHYRFNLKYCNPADALSTEQTATVESTKLQPSGSQNSQSAIVRSTNSNRGDARKVLKVREEKSKREEEAQSPLSNFKTSAAIAAPVKGNNCPVNGRPELARAYFIWLAETWRDLNLTERQKRSVTESIINSDFDLTILGEATDQILDGLNLANSYDQAGSKLTAGLVDKATAIRSSREKTKAQSLEMELAKALSRQDAAARLEAAERAEVEDRISLEDTLALFLANA